MKKLIYNSPIGPLVLIAHQGNLVYCNWDVKECRHKETAAEKFVKSQSDIHEDMAVLGIAATQLEEYFEGKRTSFSLPLSMNGTPFRMLVWKELREIPYGTMISYKELAERCGRKNSHRAVASACGANPISIIIPCHRIISAGNGLGGYTGGLDKKAALLNLEKAQSRSMGTHSG